jgi:hypothetical protein
MCLPHQTQTLYRPSSRQAELVRQLSVSHWLSFLAGKLAFGALKFFRQLLAHYGKLGWRFDADPYASVANFHHRDADVVANSDSLTEFSTEN